MKSHNKTVTVELQGGLGNQLFGWATGLCLSTRIGADLVLNTRNLKYRPYELDNFLISHHVSTTDRNTHSRNGIFKPSYNFIEASFAHDDRIREINKSVTLRGYFQSPKYFQDISQTIRSQVQLQSLSSNYFDLEAIVKRESTLAIHVRRGDYVGLENYHGLTTQNYFHKGIEIAHKLAHFEKVMVFSDDIQAARTVIDAADYYISSEQLPSAAETMILMSKCSALIGSNSSFSWWAGYLGDTPSSIRIFPRPWFAESNLDTRDLLLNHWITLGI